MSGDDVPPVGPDDPILVTGGTGFIGTQVVRILLERGFRNLRCLARPTSNLARFQAALDRVGAEGKVEVRTGNLLSRDDCVAAVRDAVLVYHLAASTGEKSFPDAFLNSVVTTRNLLDASLEHARLRRFVNVSTFAVYSNAGQSSRRVLDESSPIEAHPALRGDAYTYAKAKQDEIVTQYGEQHGLHYVIVRPGSVYGPGKTAITHRVGIGTFGLFLHLGGSNQIPLTFVDNCAEAIVLAGLASGVDGQVFNVVDDDLPSSRQFLGWYHQQVRWFPSVTLPPALSYWLCHLWEAYSIRSEGQLPPVYNRRAWHANWKQAQFSNEKAKRSLGWTPRVPTKQGLSLYFQSCREARRA